MLNLTNISRNEIYLNCAGDKKAIITDVLIILMPLYIQGDHFSVSLKMSGNLTAAREMSGTKSCHGTIHCLPPVRGYISAS